MDFISSTWALPSKLLPAKLLEMQLSHEETMGAADDGLTVIPEERTGRKKFGKAPLIISVVSTIFCVILFAIWFLNKGYKNSTSTIAVVSIGVALLIINAIIGIHAAFQIFRHKDRPPVVKFSRAVPLPMFLADEDKRSERQASLSVPTNDDEAIEAALCEEPSAERS